MLSKVEIKEGLKSSSAKSACYFILLCLGIAILFSLPCVATAHDNLIVHPYIANEGFEYINAYGLGGLMAPYLGALNEVADNNCNEAKTGDNLLQGSADEDMYDPVKDSCFVKSVLNTYVVDANYFNYHFYNPDIKIGLCGSLGPISNVNDYLQKAKDLYINSPSAAFWYVGRIAHLLADMSVPAHVLLDPHPYIIDDFNIHGDPYEAFVADFPYDWYAQQAIDLDSTNPIPYSWSIPDLFDKLAQHTQYFPSSDKNWNTTNADPRWFLGWPLNNMREGLVCQQNDSTNGCPPWDTPTKCNISDPNLTKIADKLMPLAIQYTGALYKRLWNELPPKISVNGSSLSGNISPAGDEDWFRFDITTAGTYTIETMSSTLADNYMYLYGPNSPSAWKEEDDDDGIGTSAMITRSLAPGTYYVKIRAYYSSTGTGTYTIKVYSSATVRPNLTPYTPSGWSDKIVVSKTTLTHIDSSPLYTTDILYVDWALINNGTASASSTFYTYLYVDGILKKSWYTSPPLYSNYMTSVSDFSIGALSAGTHTIKIVTDATGVITESNETDNTYSKTITVQQSTSAPTLRIDGGTSSTKAQGGTFNLTGSNFTPNTSATRYIQNPGTSTFVSSGTVLVDGSGNLNWSWSSNCETTVGTYVIKVLDSVKGYSNTVSETVTVNSSGCTPSIKQSTNNSTWATIVSGPQKSTFYTKGSGFTPNTNATRYIKRPGSTGYVSIGTVPVDPSGRLNWSYPSTCEDTIGPYYIYVKDAVKGNSNTITETMTLNSSGCTPSIKISTNNTTWSTTVSGPQKSTFYTKGSGFTPNTDVMRYVKDPGASYKAIGTVRVDSSGRLNWTYQSNCPTVGNYYIYVKDAVKGNSNTVTETITHSSSCP